MMYKSLYILRSHIIKSVLKSSKTEVGASPYYCSFASILT